MFRKSAGVVGGEAHEKHGRSDEAIAAIAARHGDAIFRKDRGITKPDLSMISEQAMESTKDLGAVETLQKMQLSGMMGGAGFNTKRFGDKPGASVIDFVRDFKGPRPLGGGVVHPEDSKK